MNYTVSQIATIIRAIPSKEPGKTVIEYLLTDSRKLMNPATSLFFALPGPRRNGLLFIGELYQKGVRNFVVDEKTAASVVNQFPDAVILETGNVLMALQDLAAHHRLQFDFPVIGITGSNGKTIVKEWLYQLLNNNYHIVRSPKSYNSQIGVPLSVWQMNQTHTLGIFEAGISQTGEMDKLQVVIRPDIGILNFIGDAHAEGFTDLKQKVNEKLLLFKESKILVYCTDDDRVRDAVNDFHSTVNKDLQLFSWSKQMPADLYISQVEKRREGSIIHCTYRQTGFNFFIPFTDEASLYNAITCCAVLLCMEVNLSAIPAAMNELRPLEMRLELKQGINQCDIINDSYSADINSIGIALDFLQQQQQHPKRTVILSDIPQSGQPDELLYERIAAILQQKKIHRFIGIGPQISSQAAAFRHLGDTAFFSSTSEFLQEFHHMHFHDETILLKGARAFLFEKISRVLEQKIHETVLEINLNALRNNLKVYRQELKKDVKLMAMVKAFSYGSGSYEIANLLQHEGADYLAVAYTDEGVELRKAGVRLPIMVMNTTIAGFDNLIQYQLEPEIYSFSILESFQYYLQQHRLNHYPVHIKLDTGMHRLGFLPADIHHLCGILSKDNPFRIQSVFSHLVASDDPSHDTFTKQQGDSFLALAAMIEKATGYPFTRHIANTSAIHRHPELQLDMVRLGIGLYGVDEGRTLQNVTTLKTTIAQIKDVKSGDSVGYSRKGIVHRDSVIATVRIGYADGYPRILGNGNGKMLVNGQLAPVIGNICMDMTMLDVTGIGAAEGDEVIVFGEDLTVKTIAQWAQTIPYEILTNISQRVKRVYFEE